jgi:endoglucanase
MTDCRSYNAMKLHGSLGPNYRLRSTVVAAFITLWVWFAASCTSAHSQAPPTVSPLFRREMDRGAIVRGPRENRRLALVFTGHEFGEGGATILDELAKRRLKASFFLTGDFLVNTRFQALVRRIVVERHYIGPHSDRHLLYCEWGTGKKTLVSRDAFMTDLRANLDKIARLGVDRPRYFLPPFEHFNQDIVDWSAELGLLLVNYTPGTRSSADYTEDDSPRFVSSRAILESIVHREWEAPHGLNGFLLLMHIGSGPRRTDKFHDHFGELLNALVDKHYQFVRVDQLLAPEAKSQ